MQYTAITGETITQSTERIKAIFRDIEKKARLAGNTTLLMSLDRIPFQLLGASNQIPKGATSTANTAALLELEKITTSLSPK